MFGDSGLGGLGFFLNLYACLSTCICSDICDICVSCIFGASKRGRNKGSWHSALLFAWCHFPVRECVTQRLSAAAQRSARTEGHPSQVTDRTVIISYSSARCSSPSEPGAPRTQPHMVSVLIIYQHVEKVKKKCCCFSHDAPLSALRSAQSNVSKLLLKCI